NDGCRARGGDEGPGQSLRARQADHLAATSTRTRQTRPIPCRGRDRPRRRARRDLRSPRTERCRQDHHYENARHAAHTHELPDPPLVVLDEPTVGLDPQASRDLRDRVRELKAQGRTVLLTTHYMEEADQLCDRVAIIDHGRIVALDTPAALKRTIRAEEVVHLEIGLEGDEGGAVLDRLGESATVARSERSNGTLTVTAHCASARNFVPAAFDAARSTGTTIRHVEVVPVTLEDVFLALTGRALRE